MEGMEEKLGAILNNPQVMQQIMSLAGSLSAQQETAANPQPAQSTAVPEFDPAMLQKIVGIAGQMGTDPNQKALLQALKPYLSASRIDKLEKAMRAAKIAGLASSALNNGALSFLTGR